MAIFCAKLGKTHEKAPDMTEKRMRGRKSETIGRNGDSNCALEEEALELTFKIGGEGLLADGGADFFECPKASTIKFVL